VTTTVLLRLVTTNNFVTSESAVFIIISNVFEDV